MSTKDLTPRRRERGRQDQPFYQGPLSRRSQDAAWNLPAFL